MEKIIKQITVNLILVIVSVVVIFMAKTVAHNRILNWKEYLGTDIIFVMITSLVTTIGWRFSENVVGHWIYNSSVCVILFIFAVEYGMSMIQCNGILIYGIEVSLVLFLFFYFVENCIIICHFQKLQKLDDKLSYNNK